MANDNNQQKSGYRPTKPVHQSMFETGGRILPQDKEIEEAVLGALMLERDAYSAVCDISRHHFMSHQIR